MLFSSLFCAAETAQNSSSFKEILSQGGFVLLVLVALSLFLIALVALLFMTLREQVLIPNNFINEAATLTEKGDMEALSQLCKGSQSPAGAIIGAAAEQMHADTDSSYDMIKDAAESEGSHQIGIIHHKLSYVSDIAKIAPMIGLLGTVLGMMQAFSGLKQDFGAVKPIALADGIAQAMVTTAAGLIVGLIAMFCHSLLRQRAGHLTDILEQKSARVLRRFMKKA
ncbi:MotA/TolQ/ExbB proton channel family protein [Lentisphaera marina]|uniref:MotA/TolQ/ExbB proton channel family protein n=1 Tax=Lentisphaera marina TaxID=1111041 RepID=UPI0023658039|nr:MotA/TolQ/ExbB proton channel family protein [Lentisphaera marina]MDD7985669.1 MotA/TolQ/ExbB proton channel family protein [Lentisphaera marina]